MAGHIIRPGHVSPRLRRGSQPQPYPSPAASASADMPQDGTRRCGRQWETIRPKIFPARTCKCTVNDTQSQPHLQSATQSARATRIQSSSPTLFSMSSTPSGMKNHSMSEPGPATSVHSLIPSSSHRHIALDRHQSTFLTCHLFPKCSCTCPFREPPCLVFVTKTRTVFLPKDHTNLPGT